MTQVVLIGCGAVSRLYYAPALRELERSKEIRVRAVYDPDPDARDRVAVVFPSAVHLEDLDALNEIGAELAIVASPPRFHAEQTMGALNAGLSVLCEKPMACSTDEARTMIAAASNSKGVLAIGFVRRFLPAAQVIHAILQQKMLGDVISFSGFEGSTFRWPVASPAYFTRSQSAGGVMLDLGSHAVDLVRWWMGEARVLGYEDDAMGGVEVNCRVQLALPDGVKGEFRFSREWERPNRYEIRCSSGWIRWSVNDPINVQLGLEKSNFVLDARTFKGGTGLASSDLDAFTFEHGFVEQIRNVAAAHHGRGTLLVSGEDGVASLALVEHCYRIRSLMEMGWLTPEEASRARDLSAMTR